MPWASLRISAIAVSSSPDASTEQRLISVVFGAAGELEEHRQRDEVLLGAVMQVTFEAAPFLVGGGDQPGT